MTPAAELHAAAAELREEAAVATPGPWRVAIDTHQTIVERDNPDVWQPVAYPGQGDEASADAAYIAAVHPGVGLLLAELLDWHAGELDSLDARPNDLAEYAEVRYARELAVARAILGTDQDAGRPA